MNLKFLILSMTIVLSGFVLADVGNCHMGGGMMYGMYGGYGQGMVFFSWITWLLTIALIIAAIYWLVKSAQKKSKRK